MEKEIPGKKNRSYEDTKKNDVTFNIFHFVFKQANDDINDNKVQKYNAQDIYDFLHCIQQYSGKDNTWSRDWDN
ncbi:MAG: hypothetical protein IPP43_00170 [Chitinophagaceae bacterium]|nr:hypothetical protein [Chitinophagaceae bacterium]